MASLHFETVKLRRRTLYASARELLRLKGLEHHYALLAGLPAVDPDGDHAIGVNRVVAKIAFRLKCTCIESPAWPVSLKCGG